MTMLDYESDAMVTEEVWEPQRPQPLSDATPPNPSATTASSHPRLKSSSSRPSLLLLSNSTTDPSLFSFDTIKKLNQQHLASIPPNPLSAISIAQHQHHLNQEQKTAVPSSASSSVLPSDSDPIEQSRPPPDLPISQPRRASAPISTTPSVPPASPTRTTEGSQPVSAEDSANPTRVQLAHRHSFDEVSLYRRGDKTSRASDPSFPSTQSKGKMAATIGFTPSDYFGGFKNTQFGNEDAFASNFASGRRPTIVTQTRELYLHPSQIFTPDISTANNDISSYFSSSLNVNSNNNNNNSTSGPGMESTIALPPMLTLEEIVQSHIFGKQEGIDTSEPSVFGMPFVPKSPSSLSNNDRTMPAEPSYSLYPDFSGDGQQPSWNATQEQLAARNSTYSSYLHPDPQIGFNGDSQSSQRFSPPSLQHARDIMAFSERVAMPPMPAPAPGSRSPSTLSGGSKPRDGSPTLPPTRDGLMSQRSMTPLDVVPQKRSGKLPAAVTTTLKNWLLAHTQHPYPTEEEKRSLCSDTGLTMNQVSNWFINARRRILPNLGNIAMSGNRKQLTQYNPPGPRRVFSHDNPQGYQPYHPASESMYAQNMTPLAAARMRSHPYGNYGPPMPPNAMHGSLAAYNYNPEHGSY